MRSSKLYTILFYAGVIIAFIGISDLTRVKYLNSNGITVEAKVVKLLPVSSDDGDDTYKAVFEYCNASGKVRTFTSSVSANPPAHKINDLVNLLYDPRDESNIRVKTFWGLHRLTIIALVLAMPLIIFGGGFLLYDRKWNKLV